MSPQSPSNCQRVPAGICVCQRGFVGSDCSIDLTVGPRVTSLQDGGLCDVTTRPCRQVVIQGDNFADQPDLVCHFEIYNVSDAPSLFWGKHRYTAMLGLNNSSIVSYSVTSFQWINFGYCLRNCCSLYVKIRHRVLVP